MPKTVFVLIAVVVIVSVLIIGGAYFLKNRNSSQKNLPDTNPQKPIQSTSGQLPVNPSITGVKEAVVNYVFSTSIALITNTETGLSLKTPIQQGNTPNFSIVKNTLVVFNDSGTQTPATQKDLKINQRIVVIADYNLKNKIWSTRKIHILTGKSLLSTPSASVKS